MTTISRVSENRKIDLPPLEALVWAAVLQLPSEQGLLLRALLTKDHDFQHPKRGHVVRDLARHMKVTDRTIRNWVDEALANPILHKAALGALPEIGVELAGLDQSPERGGRSVRTWSSADSGRAGGSNAEKQPGRSRHDRTRGNWAWSERQKIACERGEDFLTLPAAWVPPKIRALPPTSIVDAAAARIRGRSQWGASPLAPYRGEPEPERGVCLPCRQGTPMRVRLDGYGYAWYSRRRQRSKGDGRVTLTRSREVITTPESIKHWLLIVEPVSRVEYDGAVYWRPGCHLTMPSRTAAQVILSSEWKIPTQQVRAYGRRRAKRATDYAWLGRGQRVHLWWAQYKLLEAKRHGNGREKIRAR